MTRVQSKNFRKFWSKKNGNFSDFFGILRITHKTEAPEDVLFPVT